MPNQVTVTTTVTAGGISYGSTELFTDESLLQQELTLTKGQAGSLTTRTDDDEGTVTLTTGHGITTGQICDLYWTAGGVDYCNRGVTVGTVSSNSVPITCAAGSTALPAQDTSVILSPTTVATFAVQHDEIAVVWVRATGDGSANFLTSVPASCLALDLTENIVWMWSTSVGTSNPFSADIATVRVSTKETDADDIINIGVLMDAIP